MQYKPDLATLHALAGLWRLHPRYARCVGHWLMGEGGGQASFDLSGYGARAAHQATTPATLWEVGPRGWVPHFDGTDDSLDAGVHTRHAPAGHFSFGCWLKWDAPPNIFVGPVGKTNDPDWTQGWGIYADGAASPATTISGFMGHYSSGKVELGAVTFTVWQHVFWTVDGVTLRGYRNGVQVATSGSFGDHTTGASTNALNIGRVSGPGTYHDGHIDDLRLYNRVLTAAEVYSLYADPLAEFRWALATFLTLGAEQIEELIRKGALALLGVGR